MATVFSLSSPRWSALTVWPQGVLVRHGKLLYRALGIHNVAIPGDSHHGRFFVSIRCHEKIYSVKILLSTCVSVLT